MDQKEKRFPMIVLMGWFCIFALWHLLKNKSDYRDKKIDYFEKMFKQRNRNYKKLMK